MLADRIQRNPPGIVVRQAVTEFDMLHMQIEKMFDERSG